MKQVCDMRHPPRAGTFTLTLTVQPGYGSWVFSKGPNTIVLAGVTISPTVSTSQLSLTNGMGCAPLDPSIECQHALL